jgi:hypothetical protein
VLVSLRPPATVLEKNHASFDHNLTNAHLSAVGIQGSAPKTFPRNVWLKDVMGTAFGDNTVYDSFHDQLDGFVKLIMKGS